MIPLKDPRSPSKSSGSADSIHIWLDRHPLEPAEYISPDSQAPCPSPYLMRRRRLKEIDPPNNMSQYQTRSRRFSPEDKSGSPLLEIFVTDDFQLRENSELYTSDRAE
ncbi:hypothetical protein ABVK25_004555 [Lepraria finkii]|uniref:Uncharacterized protein n=1 Tax=Lepraria finkii TaxID=1340010 RepID=A0ABR4BCQ5_9LECA